MAGFWKTLKRSLLSGVRQHVTRAGLWFTAACALIALAAFASANNLLFLILAAMLATMLVSGFISRLSLSGLEIDFHIPEHISAGRQVAGRAVVRNAKRWMPSFSIRLAAEGGNQISAPLYFPVIPGHASAEGPVQLRFARRGVYRDGGFRFSTRFPFGFTERRIHVLLRRDVLVYPSIEPREEFEQLLVSITGEIEAQVRGAGHDFYRIRPYEALESARHVDWKATAHTGDLQVREFARDQDLAIALCLDLDLREADPEWFERAVSCAAFLAWRIHERGARLLFFTQEYSCETEEDNAVFEILRYLATVKPRRGKLDPPVAAGAFRIALTSSPERLLSQGWDCGNPLTMIVGPDGAMAKP
ncbi:MAG: DUF58 domain-containing protein [Bryobacteraceae bacterium]